MYRHDVGAISVLDGVIDKKKLEGIAWQIGYDYSLECPLIIDYV